MGWMIANLPEVRERREKLSRGEISDIVRQEAFKGDLEDAIAILIGEQARRSEQLWKETTPMRERAYGTLLGQLGAGPLETPDVSGLADVANPFRRGFSYDLKLPGATPAAAEGKGILTGALRKRKRKTPTTTEGSTTPKAATGGARTRGGLLGRLRDVDLVRR